MYALPPPEPALEAPCPAEARELHRGVLCGYLRVPLDRAKPGGRTIRIYFERYPRRDRSQRRLSTVVSIQGGPGFPTAADRAGRVAVWRPVSARRALLLMDLRGTGESGALACRAFARSSRGYIARAGRCAAQLGPRRDLYSTAQAVEDLEAVLTVFRMRKIDLYGDSYGTYAAQAYALRHPERLRSLVLDGAYPLPGTDPAWADLVEAIRRGLSLTCERRPGCPAGEDPVDLAARFADHVRARPIRGFAPDGDGTRTRVRLNEDAYVQAVSSGYYYPALWRDLPAAIVAARNGDARPMLRLAAETVTIDAPTTDPAESSEALYLAVICHDYPQLWDPATPLAARAAEARSRIAAYPAGTFTPFSAGAWTGTEYEGVLACLRWPSPFRPDPPDPPGAVYPAVPTLVLNGDLDTITASSGAREVADRFPGSTFVELQNSFHVLALYDRDRCASRIYVNFLRTLRAGDTSCATRVPEVRVLEAFPRRLTRTQPADPAPGDGSTVRDRRLAAAAALTVSDVINRWFVNYDGTSVGLRGGRWSYSGDDPVVFELDGVKFVGGVPVSGTASWSPTGGRVRARVRVRDPFGPVGTLRLRWSLGVPLATATLRGAVGGRPLRARMLAP
jgi:pimeloyl-ACP methyl ester carboxylesterase